MAKKLKEKDIEFKDCERDGLPGVRVVTEGHCKCYKKGNPRMYQQALDKAREDARWAYERFGSLDIDPKLEILKEMKEGGDLDTNFENLEEEEIKELKELDDYIKRKYG